MPETSIVDNRDDNTLLARLVKLAGGGRIHRLPDWVFALPQKCLDAKGLECEPWEKEIDERVAALYGL